MGYRVKAVLLKGRTGGEKEIRRFEVDCSDGENEFGFLQEKITRMFPSLTGTFDLYWKGEIYRHLKHL